MDLRTRMTASFLLLAMLIPFDVMAHAFGQRYDLPLPLGLYLWSAGFAVALSFIIAVLFLRIRSFAHLRWTLDISHMPVARALNATPVRYFLQLLGLSLFALVLITGLFSTQDPAKNFAPIFVWVIWWVGMAYLAAFIGNLWELVNPWRVLYRLASRWMPQLAEPLCTYPERLGHWPAVVLFFSFAWLEFISGFAQHPAMLAWLVIGYSLITFIGMRVFGLHAWLLNGEAFTVLFDLMSRFSVFHGEARSLQLRLPGVGLMSERPVSIALMAFTVLMLATVTFDGFIETPLWSRLNGELFNSVPVSLSSMMSAASVQKWLLSIALLVFYLLFLVIYLGFCALVCRLSSMETTVLQTARSYVLALVPIAIAYHLAHYLSYLMIAGQLLIPIVSDPFGLGWDLFGTAAYRIDISVIDAKDVWYLSVCAIVIGHIAAVCIAHATALQRETSALAAVISQLPMLILMIAYTMISLWILSQPIIA